MGMSAAGALKTSGPFPFDDVDPINGQTYSVTGHSSTTGLFDRELKSTNEVFDVSETEYQAITTTRPGTLYVRRIPAIVAVTSPPATFDRTDFTGMVGYSFTLSANTPVNSLGRAIGTVFLESHTVGIWRDSDQKLMRSVAVSPASSVVNGYAMEVVEKIILEPGNYRIAVSEVIGQDNWVGTSAVPIAAGITVTNGVYETSPTVVYPSLLSGGASVGFAHPNFSGESDVIASVGTDTSNILSTSVSPVNQVFDKTSSNAQSGVAIEAAVTIKWTVDETPAPVVGTVREHEGFYYRLNDAATKGSAVDPTTNPSTGFGTTSDDWVVTNPTELYHYITTDLTRTLTDVMPGRDRVSVDLHDNDVNLTYPAGLPLGYVIDTRVSGYTENRKLTISVTGETLTDENRVEAVDGNAEISNVAGESAWRKISLAPPVWQQFKSHAYAAAIGYPSVYHSTLTLGGADTYSGTITTADASTIDIDWGDGTTENIASGATFSHTFATAPANPFTFEFTEWQRPVASTLTAGAWNTSVAELLALSRYQTITSVDWRGSNTQTGTIEEFQDQMTFYINLGPNTLSGSVARLPAAMTYFRIAGSNTTEGSIEQLPVGLTQYINEGLNTSTGSIEHLPTAVTNYTNNGNNTSSGSLAGLPAGLTTFICLGQNTISGPLDALPTGVVTYVNVGENTVSGSIENLPAGITYLQNDGFNTVTGSLHVGFPLGLQHFSNGGNNTCICTGVPVFGSTMNTFLQRGTAFTSSDIDNVLEGLATHVTTWVGNQLVDLRVGTLAQPTTASAPHIATITGLGATVLVH